MATTESIRRAVDQLVAVVLEADSLAHVCSDLAAHDPHQPPWVFAFSQQIGRIKASSEALERVVNLEVVPVLEGRT